MTRSPTNTTQRHQRQYTTILTSILIIGILSIGTFISTRQFYTEVSSTTQDTNSLLQTVGTSSNSSREDNSTTTSNHLRVQQKDNDDTKDLPVAEELFEGANDNDDGEKIISIAKNEDEDRDLPITEELFEVVANNYTGSVDNVTNVEDGNMINHANDKNDDGDKIISIAKNEDEDRDLPITEELFEVVANGNHSDGSVDNVTNIGHMNNQGNESSSGEGGEQISSGKIIEEIISNDQVDDNETSSNAKDEEEEESCFRPRRYNKSKSRLSTPCEIVCILK